MSTIVGDMIVIDFTDDTVSDCPEDAASEAERPWITGSCDFLF
jgi:hypothetical protein